MAVEYQIPGIGRIIPEDYSVLLLDDDEDVTRNIAEHLMESNFKVVDQVHSRDEATSLVRERWNRNRPYDAVVADVLVEERSPVGKGERQGDTWLLEHAQELKNTSKIIFTGWERLIREPEALKRMNTTTISKGVSGVNTLIDRIEQLAMEKNKRVADTLRGLEPAMSANRMGASPSLPDAFPLGIPVAREAAEMFRGWLNQQGDPGDFGMLIGKRTYTASELAEELGRGSEVGQKLLRMFLRHIRYRLGWEEVPTYEQKLDERSRS